jgi:hypothetical protein
MKISREIHPSATLPEDKTLCVWRYMDFWKFENLINTRSLYLCRLDKLQDQFEGTYSRQQIEEMETWIERNGCQSIVEGERKYRELKRKQHYISSWCMGEHDLDLMWKGYCSGFESVAIQSTLQKLEAIADQAIDQWPVDISLVKYINHAGGEHIDYAGGFDAAITKDHHFQLDREVRIVSWPNFQEPIPQKVMLQADLNILIEKVILHPQSPEGFVEKIKSILATAGLFNVVIETSRHVRPVAN